MMKIKVCGMKYEDNLKALSALSPDYMGFIFYERSKRFVGENFDEKILDLINPYIIRTGVFVNHTEEYILKKAERYKLNVIQLHGDESPELCESLRKKGFQIVKVFQTDKKFDFKTTTPFNEVADYFLFDTKSENYCLNFNSFDWSIFKKYDNKKPIFLSGGIGPESIEEIKKLDGLNIHALDINSKFEISPAIKDVKKITEFISQVRELKK
jgi:phosphoribosylanthranilate isomerase